MNDQLYKCNKLFALYTQEEKDQIDSILAEFLLASKKVEKELQQGKRKFKNPEEATSFWTLLNTPYSQKIEAITNAVRARYILAFNGDATAILEDVREILNVIDKKDFMQEIKIRKMLIFSEDTLLHSFERIQDPIKREEAINNIPAIIKSRKQAVIANYWNCYDFLLSQLTDQIEALQQYGLPLSGLEELTAARASEWYKKPKSKPKGSTTHIEKAVEQAKKLFYDMPNSTASHLLFDILSAGDSIADLPARKKQVNHGTIYEVKASGDKRLVSMENYEGTAKVTVELSDINKLNKAGKKLLILSLVKANEQALHNGELTRDYISFPLQDLIHYGLYARLNGARKGFEIGTDALTSIKVKGTIRKSKKSTATIKALEVPFTGAKIENNQCYIYLNTRIDWNFLTQYFTKIPKYYFKLSNRASDLLYYIFYLARQHTKEIASRGYFTISFRAIHNLLKLPSEINNRKPQQYIKEPIENAVEEIEKEHKQMYGNKEFSLELVYDEKAGISEYLDNGYLKVSLKGAFAEPFISQNQTQQKKIQQAEQKKARIEEKAIAMKMAKEDKTET